MKARPMTKMRIPFNDGNFVGETLWVTPMGRDNYRIENNPLCGFLFYRDIVKATLAADGWLTYRWLIIRAKPELRENDPAVAELPGKLTDKF